MKGQNTTQHPEDVLFRHVKTVHNLGSVVDAMQEYSDQQNAELRERVKELEGALTATLNVARAYDRSRFVDILDKAEKTLKK